MKKLHFTHAITSAVLVYIVLIPLFIGSYYVPVLEDPDFQANLVLIVAMVPAAILAAHVYYRRGHQTSGLSLGLFMFSIAIVLDALITVPIFILPAGGTHLSFFSDSAFWLIGVVYVIVVAGYWRINKARKRGSIH